MSNFASHVLVAACAAAFVGCAPSAEEEALQDEYRQAPVGRQPEADRLLRQAVVQISYGGAQFCTGTYLGNGNVLTSAGCFPFNSYPYHLASVTMWLASGERLLICNGAARRPTKRFIGREEQWNNDVALFKTDPVCLKQALREHGLVETGSLPLDLTGTSAPTRHTGILDARSYTNPQGLFTIKLDSWEKVDSEEDLDPVLEVLFEETGDVYAYWREKPEDRSRPQESRRMEPNPDNAQRLLAKAEANKAALWKTIREGAQTCYLSKGDDVPSKAETGAPAYLVKDGKFQVVGVYSHSYWGMGIGSRGRNLRGSALVCFANLAPKADWIREQLSLP